MEDMVGILMRHSEEGETPERRAGGQMKGLLLKVSSSGDACGVGEWALQTLPLPALLGKPALLILLTHSPAARICVRLVRRPRPQVLATEYPAAKVSKAG